MSDDRKKNFAIFRYRRPNKYSLESLKKDEFWLSRPDKFNDSSDSTFYIDFEVISKKICEYIYETEEARNISTRARKDIREMAKRQFGNLNDDLKRNIGVACFSEEMNNQSMWASYAEDSKGFVIEYSYLDIVSFLDSFGGEFDGGLCTNHFGKEKN